MVSRSRFIIISFISVFATNFCVQASELFSGVSASTGELSYVVCTSSAKLNVRDQSLANVLFQVAPYTKVLPVQSFGEDRADKVISGKLFSFMKVQFPEINLSANMGWVAADAIRLASQCQTPLPTVKAVGDGRYTFPTAKRPTANYKTGMRAFKASRGGGSRYHAAVDLYRKHNDPTMAVTTGTVIRGRYAFYQGTYAIEVKHSDGKIIRYGEITGATAVGVLQGSQVSTGQTIGYIGTVNSGCCSPMLHFEMYSGKATGALSQGGNKFQRRSDLIDPSVPVTQWEKAQFGVSY